MPGGLVVELEKEVGVWFRLLQRFQRHPGIQVCSPESAELLWIPFCRSITYRVQSGFCSLDSGIRAAGRQQVVAGNSTLLRGETRDPAANIHGFIWNSLVIWGTPNTNIFLWNSLIILGTPNINQFLWISLLFRDRKG